MIVRILVFNAAAAGLLLAAGHAAAQAPHSGPPAPDVAKQLQALEQKMDRIEKLLAGRAPVGPPVQVSETTLELINQARNTLTQKFEAQQQAYQDFKLRNPYLSSLGTKGVADRLAKDEARIYDLRQRRAEVDARMTLVKNVGDSEKQASALLVLVHRRGVDLAPLRQAAGKEVVSPLEMLQLYAASLKLEAEEVDQLMSAAEHRRDQDEKLARDMHAYEVEEERLRNSLEQSRQLLHTIIKRLQEISLMKDAGGKP